MKQQQTNGKRQRLALLHVLLFLMGATLFLLLSPHQVSSLGVAPSLFNLDNPDNIIELRLRILNSQQEDLFVAINPTGPLADYVKLDKRTYRLTPKEAEKTIYYTLQLPTDLPPGQNVLTMYVVQLDEYIEEEELSSAQLNAKVSVVQRVNVNIPYPGQYVTGNLFVQAENTDTPVEFIVHAINKGDQEVEVTGKLTIKSPTNELLTTLPIQSIRITGSSDAKIPLSIPGLSNAGEYTAEAYIFYGQEQFVMKQQFVVGNKLVQAYNLVIERFKLGEIVKVGIDVSSEWNELIENIIAKGKVIDPESGQEISGFESTTIDLPAQGVARMNAFWDTQGIAPGAYDIDVQLHYDDKVTQNFFDTVVSIDAIQISKQGLTGQVISNSMKEPSDGTGSNQTLNLLVFLVIGLIIAVVILFVKMSKKK